MSLGDWDPTNARSSLRQDFGAQKTGPYGSDSLTGADKAADQSGNVRNSGGYDTANQDQSRAGQQGLTGMLQAQAAGYGPSVAQSQFAQGAQQAAQSGQSMFNNVRGAGGALNAYYANQGVANNTLNAANQSGQLRANEMLTGRAALGQNLDQTRGQDLNAGQMQQQNQQFNSKSFNDFLLQKQQQQAELQKQQNDAIYGTQAASAKSIQDLRNQSVMLGEKTALGAATGGGSAAGAGASAGAAAGGA